MCVSRDDGTVNRSRRPILTQAVRSRVGQGEIITRQTSSCRGVRRLIVISLRASRSVAMAVS